MRAAVIGDTDGSREFQKVKLKPQNWCAFNLPDFCLFNSTKSQGLVG